MKQQYFFVSASLQDIIRRFKEGHDNFDELPEKVQCQTFCLLHVWLLVGVVITPLQDYVAITNVFILFYFFMFLCDMVRDSGFLLSFQSSKLSSGHLHLQLFIFS